MYSFMQLGRVSMIYVSQTSDGRFETRRRCLKAKGGSPTRLNHLWLADKTYRNSLHRTYHGCIVGDASARDRDRD